MTPLTEEQYNALTDRAPMTTARMAELEAFVLSGEERAELPIFSAYPNYDVGSYKSQERKLRFKGLIPPGKYLLFSYGKGKTDGEYHITVRWVDGLTKNRRING